MAIVYNTSIVRSGLTLLLDAANIKSYPGSGSTWFDLSGNSLNTSLINGAAYNSNNTGSIVFDGVDDAVTLSANDALATSGSVTICSTFQRTAGTVGTLYRIQFGNESTYSLQLNSTGPFTQWWTTGNTRVTHQCNFAFNSNQIYHVAVTITPSSDGLTNTSKFYVNGSLITSVATTDGFPRRSTSGTLWIGSGVNGAGTPIVQLTGNIYNTLFYKRELSALEIQQNFEAVRGRYSI